MTINTQNSWVRQYGNRNEMAYPPEYVIRIFKGNYPRLALPKNSFSGKKIVDVGCGDGRCLPFFKDLGFEPFGVEIAQEAVAKIQQNLANCDYGDQINLAVGSNSALSFNDNFFDYLLSWNACYYMGSIRSFASYVKEFARVLKKDGQLILSIPKKTCFIYKGSIEVEPGYRVITQDPFNARNGDVLRMFENEQDIENEFSSHFTNFTFASIEDDCFGYDYHWHLVVCTKKDK